MIRFCAWCEKRLEESAADPEDRYTVTHGICEKCRRLIRTQWGMPLAKFLDELAEPVIVTDSKMKVKMVNLKAQEMLKKSRFTIEGRLPGEIFQCIHTLSSEGCGRSIHCSGCAIRKTVAETHQSGQSHKRIPAVLLPDQGRGLGQVELLISTEKIEDMVLLRIDEIQSADQVDSDLDKKH